MRYTRLTLALTGGVLALAVLAVPGARASSPPVAAASSPGSGVPIPAAVRVPAAVHQQEICVQNGAGTPCLNEWNGDRNAGAPIKMYTYNNGTNDEWNYHVIDPCNSGGVVTQTCPFPVGSGLNSALAGKVIVQFQFEGGVNCLATSAAGLAVNGSCGNQVTGSGESNGAMLVLDGSGCQYSNYCAVVDKYWTSTDGVIVFTCSQGLSNGVPVKLNYATGACGSGDGYWFDFATAP